MPEIHTEHRDKNHTHPDWAETGHMTCIFYLCGSGKEREEICRLKILEGGDE